MKFREGRARASARARACGCVARLPDSTHLFNCYLRGFGCRLLGSTGAAVQLGATGHTSSPLVYLRAEAGGGGTDALESAQVIGGCDALEAFARQSLPSGLRKGARQPGAASAPDQKPKQKQKQKQKQKKSKHRAEAQRKRRVRSGG